MRKLIFGINLTLDGCCDHTKGAGYDDVHDYFAQLTWHANTLVYGRKTYQLMVPFWPDFAKNNSGAPRSMNEFAQAFNSVKKIIVFSRSLDRVEGNAEIVRTDLRDEILKLKQQEGNDILTGGVDIPSQLIQLGLIDEYRIVVQPTLVGDGRRLLEGYNLQEKLRLVDTKVFNSGCVALRYVKA